MSANNPRVSVITTVRNGERFLAAAIESILAQSFTDFEYLLVDDASTDGSGAIIARYAAEDARIVPLHKAFSVNHSHAINASTTPCHFRPPGRWRGGRSFLARRCCTRRRWCAAVC